jgi:hypothetical protein
LITVFFLREGELRPELRRQGLAYVAYFRETASFYDTEDLKQNRYLGMLDLVETTIYAMWLWSDLPAARKALASKPRSLQLRAFATYLTNVAQVRPRQWRSQ